jgi:hypothetical protein
MQKWEYLELKVDHSENIVDFINGEHVTKQRIDLFQYLARLGKEGWELVTRDHDILNFKRPLP